MKKIGSLALLCLFFLSCSAMADYPKENKRASEIKKIKGHTDTPKLPGEKWHVHDPDRPQPEVVEPQYDGEPVSPPEEAIVLFEGKNLDQWLNDKWTVKDGYMQVTKGDQISKKTFGPVHLHVEWMVPESIGGWGQKRGNSGVFLMGRYEIQVLDAWANRTYPDGMAGAIYGQKPARVNASRPPGHWQTFDIRFHPPLFDGKDVERPARMTVKWNNVTIHEDYELLGRTLYRQKPSYKPHPRRGKIVLQDHGNPVRFRNIWVKPLD